MEEGKEREIVGSEDGSLPSSTIFYKPSIRLEKVVEASFNVQLIHSNCGGFL